MSTHHVKPQNSQDNEHIHHPRKFLPATLQFLTLLLHSIQRQPLISQYISLHFIEISVNGIIQCIFWSGFPHSRYFHPCHAGINGSFLFTTGNDYIVQLYHNLFIHSPVDRYLSSFQIKAFTSKAAVNICFHFSWVNK